MLQSFRENLKGMAAAVLVAILVIPFALYGVDSLFVSGSSVESALVVNGERITELTVLQRIQSEKNRILSENQGLDAALLDDDLLRPQVENQLIAGLVVSQAATDLGMTVADKAIAEALLSTPAFQTDGRFDQDRYQFVLRNQGYSSATFKAMMVEDFLNQQFSNGIVASSFATAADIRTLAAIVEQTRDYYYLSVPAAEIASAVEISDAQIESYYQNNQSSFEIPQRVIVDYVELSLEMLAADVEVSESEVQSRLQQLLENVDSAPSRLAAHIFLLDPQQSTVDEIAQKIAAGEDFSSLAKQYSEDPGSAELGGELGYSSGDTFPEAFEQALAELAVGQVSAAVRSDAGVHFIKLLDVQQQGVDSAGERTRIVSELQREKSADLLVEKLETMKELSFSAENLEEVASALNLSLQRSEPIAKSGGGGIAAYPKVLKAVFSDDVRNDGFASEVLDLGNDRYMVVKLAELIPASVRAMDEVKTSIIASLTAQRTAELLEQRGTQLTAAVQAGMSIEQLAKEQGLQWQVVMDARADSADVNVEVRNIAFTLQAPDNGILEVDHNRLSNGDLVVVAVSDVQQGSADTLSQQQRNAIVYSTMLNNSTREYVSYRSDLIEQADVQR